MANLNGLAAIASRLRAERTNLLNQLKHVDAALSVLGKLDGGSFYTKPRRTLSASGRKRIRLSQKAKRTTKNVQSMRDMGSDLLSEQDLYGSGRLRTLEELEHHYIRQVLRKEGGHVESAARKLGIPRSSLYHKLKKHQRLSA